MAGGIGIFSAEGRPKGVNVGKGAGHGLSVELSGYCQIGGLSKEVFGEIDGPIGMARGFVQIEGGDEKLLASSFAIRGCNDGRLHIQKSLLLEKQVGGKGECIADACDSALCICARAQMGDIS